MLEYQLSRAIAEVSRTDKPVIGLMSALPIAGGPPMMPGQPPAPAVGHLPADSSSPSRSRTSA